MKTEPTAHCGHCGGTSWHCDEEGDRHCLTCARFFDGRPQVAATAESILLSALREVRGHAEALKEG